MLYLLQALSAWSIAALGLGLFFGVLSWKAAKEAGRPASRLGGALLFLLPVLAGVVVAWMRWLPGRYGLWLETGLLLLVAYLVGCALGCLLRRLFSRGSAAPEAVSLDPTGGFADSMQQSASLATPAAPAASDADQKNLVDAAAPPPPPSVSPPSASAPSPASPSSPPGAPPPEQAADEDNLQEIKPPIVDAEASLAAEAVSLDPTIAAEDLMRQIEALAAATPAALAASEAAQEILADAAAPAPSSPYSFSLPYSSSPPWAPPPKQAADEGNLQEIKPPIVDAEASLAAEAISLDPTGAVDDLMGQIEALAAATPAALAASEAAQEILADAAAPAPSSPYSFSLPYSSSPPWAPPPKQAADEGNLQEIKPPIVDAEASLAAEAISLDPTGAVDDLMGQIEALAAATPAALAASDAAQKILADAAAPAASPPPSAPPPLPSPPWAPREDEDNLRLIHGVDENIALELHNLSVCRFDQIAAWTPEQQHGIGEKIRQGGPLARLYWVDQARLLAGGVETEFSRAVRLGEADREAMEAPLDEAAAGILLAALPQVIMPHGNDEIYAGLRPLSLLQPPYGEKDELARISGIDPEIAERLQALGVWTYAQIARWSEENARWIGSYLAFPGRVEAENWVGQARVLAEARDAAAGNTSA